MNRQQKELAVQLLREGFSQSQASFLVLYRGLTVSQMQSLRKELGVHGGRLKVAKARLMKRATEGVEGMGDFVPFFKDQIGVVFASDEPPAVAKVLYEFSKQHEALQLVIGRLDSQMLDKKAIVRIASLPSKDVLLAQACGAIKAPIVNFANVLNIQLLRLLLVLKQIAQKK